MAKRKATKDFIWNALGLTFNALNSLFFLIIVKLINGMNEAGVFTYAFSLCCLFYVLATFFNRAFQVSDTKFSFNDCLSCRVLFSIISLVMILVFSIISGFAFYKILVIFLLMIFRVIESISDCFYGELQKSDRLYKTGISLVLKAIIGVLSFLVIDLLTKSVLLSILSLVMVNLIIFVLYDVKNYSNISGKKIMFTAKNFKSLCKIGLPVFIFSALSIYLANCQKYILTYFAPNDVQTIFGILIMPATAMSLIGAYLSNPAIQKLTEYNTKKQYREYLSLSKTLLSAIVGFGVLAIILSFVIGIPIIDFIYKINLSEYKADLVVVVVASILYTISLVTSNFLTILEENKCQTYIYMTTALVSTVVSIIAIMGSSIHGAVYSFLISNIILTCSYIVLFAKTIAKKGVNRR